MSEPVIPITRKQLAEIERKATEARVRKATSGQLLAELERRGYEFTLGKDKFVKKLKSNRDDHPGRLQPSPEGVHRGVETSDVWCQHGPGKRQAAHNRPRGAQQ